MTVLTLFNQFFAIIFAHTKDNFCFRMDVNDLDLVSCTDTKCLWKMPHTKSMEKYMPSPLCEHECLNKKFKKEYIATLTEEQRKEINELLITNNQNSALYKHMYG